MAGKLGTEGILARTDGLNGEPADDQGRGVLRPVRPRLKKGRKPGEKLRGCKLSIPDPVFERLRQTAIKRGSNMSVVAGDILGRYLPYFEVIQRDKPPAEE